jgi:hypothetical protein
MHDGGALEWKTLQTSFCKKSNPSGRLQHSFSRDRTNWSKAFRTTAKPNQIRAKLPAVATKPRQIGAKLPATAAMSIEIGKQPRNIYPLN